MRPSDVLLPVAMATWLVALRGVRTAAIDDWGLLSALPVAFFVALGLLLVSIALALTDDELSPARLCLHVVALVSVLHGTVPILFPAANYPWVYKHVGVVSYIDLNGALDTSVDIYQNWPGFFAVAAWLTAVAGAGSPLAIAKWAPLYFNLLFCLELAFVLRAVGLSHRTRWLALFVFVAGNWVGQDYFAPQALAFVLSLAVFGIVLTWLRVDRRPALVRAVAGMARRALRADGSIAGEGDQPPRLSGRARWFVLGSAVSIFAVVVVTHQLTPYFVLLGIGLLAATGMVRPRWVVVVMASLTFSYLVLRLPFLRGDGHLTANPFSLRAILDAIGNPFNNAQSIGFIEADPLPGRRITSLGSPVLILGLWALGAVGAVRRARSGRPVLLLVLLAASPALLALGQNYGGEAIFRIYLFSLPWTAALAASALAPLRSKGRRSSPGGATWTRGSAVPIAVALGVVSVLFMSAFYGSVELYRVRPGALAATQGFYDRARPGSVLALVAPNAPLRVGGRYDRYMAGSTPPALSSDEEFRDRLFGPADLPALSAYYREHADKTPGDVYLLLSLDQQAYVEVLGLMPRGALASLDRVLASSTEWVAASRNADAVLYRLLPRPS